MQLSITLQPCHNGDFMTFDILPNIALGMGVILVVTSTDGSTIQIPCHNRATADFYKRNWANPEIAKAATSWAK
jgi:hypothetical protein